jgi:ankyrin repeat protein
MNRIDQELFDATAENDVSEVRRLLSVGADVNAMAEDGFTPLHLTTFQGLLAVFQALLEHGADIEAKTHAGWTPLHWACCNGHLAVVVELLSPSNDTITILGKR